MHNDMPPLTVIELDIHVGRFKVAFARFARALSHTLLLDYDRLLGLISGLKSNETAGIGEGVAILHGWSDEVEQPVMCFMRLRQPVPAAFAPDHEPVDVILMLLSPRREGPVHLARLSRVTRFLKDAHVRAMLRGATSPEAVQAIFANAEFHQAKAA